MQPQQQFVRAEEEVGDIGQFDRLDAHRRAQSETALGIKALEDTFAPPHRPNTDACARPAAERAKVGDFGETGAARPGGRAAKWTSRRSNSFCAVNPAARPRCVHRDGRGPCGEEARLSAEADHGRTNSPWRCVTPSTSRPRAEAVVGPMSSAISSGRGRAFADRAPARRRDEADCGAQFHLARQDDSALASRFPRLRRIPSTPLPAATAVCSSAIIGQARIYRRARPRFMRSVNKLRVTLHAPTRDRGPCPRTTARSGAFRTATSQRPWPRGAGACSSRSPTAGRQREHVRTATLRIEAPGGVEYMILTMRR